MKRLGLLALVLAASQTTCLSLDSFLFTGVPTDHYALSYDADWPQDRRVPADLTEEIPIASDAQTTIYAVFAKRPPSEMSTAPTVVYHHGQGDNIDYFWQRVSHIWSLGANVIVYDYRGYGRSQGDPTEAGIYVDAHAVVAYLHSLGSAIDQTKIFQYGYSMGSGPATEMAQTEHGPRGLILEAPFTSIGALVADGSLVVSRSFVLSASFDNLSKIRAAARASHDGVLIFHGTSDTYVQTKYGEQLCQTVSATPASGKVDLQLVTGADHGDVPSVGDANANQYSDNLRAFLADMPVGDPMNPCPPLP